MSNFSRIMVVLLAVMMTAPALAVEGSVRTVLCKVSSYDSTMVTLACGKHWIKAPRAMVKAKRLKLYNVVGVPLDPIQWKQFRENKVYQLK